jgi:transposase-like protein
MHGSRPRVSPGQRRSWWARQVARQQSTNVPVIRFCQQLGVPTSTFYDWKRRFARAQKTSSQPSPLTRSSPNPTGREQSSTLAASFVPVSVLSPALDTQIEIELTNACVPDVRQFAGRNS